MQSASAVSRLLEPHQGRFDLCLILSHKVVITACYSRTQQRRLQRGQVWARRPQPAARRIWRSARAPSGTGSCKNCRSPLISASHISSASVGRKSAASSASSLTPQVGAAIEQDRGKEDHAGNLHDNNQAREKYAAPRRKAEDAPLFRPTLLEIGVGASLSAVTERCGIARMRFPDNRKRP
jgi:hypothetical protein